MYLKYTITITNQSKAWVETNKNRKKKLSFFPNMLKEIQRVNQYLHQI